MHHLLCHFSGWFRLSINRICKCIYQSQSDHCDTSGEAYSPNYDSESLMIFRVLCVSAQCIISELTQQSRTLLSSYISTCLFPRLNKCSMAATSRGAIASACVLNEYRTKSRNLGRIKGGLVETMRSALRPEVRMDIES